jgi:hypothetical protein
MIEGFVLIILIALAAIGSITLVFAIVYYYTEVTQPKRYEKENIKAETERAQREHEDIDSLIAEALRG